MGTTRRRGRRWLIGIAVTVAALVMLAGLVLTLARPGPGAPPPALPPAGGPPVAADAAGTWTVSAGSRAGFRITETIFGAHGAITGYTRQIGGSAVIAGDRLTAARFTIDLRTVASSGKQQAQFLISADVARYPQASFELTRPVDAAALARGATVAAAIPGRLTLHGVTRPATATVSARLSGGELAVAGSVPIVLAQWGIKPPGNYGPIGSLSDHGSAEWLLRLRRG